MQMLDETVAVLRAVPMFRRIDEKRLKLFAFVGQTLTYNKDERVFEMGDEGDAAFVILEGKVDVVLPMKSGDVSVATLGKHEVFGEMAVFCEKPRSASIVALEDLVLLRFDRDALMNLLKEFPDFALDVIRLLATRIENTNKRLAASQS